MEMFFASLTQHKPNLKMGQTPIVQMGFVQNLRHEDRQYSALTCKTTAVPAPRKCFLIDKEGRHLFSIMGQVEWKASFLYNGHTKKEKKALIRREMYHFVLMLL